MATVTKPMALDESIKTTESTSRNIADVLAQELSGIASAITGGDGKANKTDIATVEPTNTASRAYSVGELVYVNGNLYKVITAITIGATFTVGTNIQSTNVSGTVKDVLDSLATDFALGNETKLYIPIKYTTNYSFMYLHMYGIYAGTNVAFQSAISARNSNNTWVFSSTDANISVDKLGDNLRITFPNAYAVGTYSVKYVQ